MEVNSWAFTANPVSVLFGSGEIQKVPQELQRLRLSKPLLLSTATGVGRANKLAKILQGNGITAVEIFAEAKMHTPIPVTQKALAFATKTTADCVVSIGGGSATGLGKAISIRTGLYHICIPTTYAGSEMTSSLGETENGRKTTRRDPKIQPGTVIYDVDLTLTFPPELSAVSGVNALAHAGKNAVSNINFEPA